MSSELSTLLHTAQRRRHSPRSLRQMGISLICMRRQRMQRLQSLKIFLSPARLPLHQRQLQTSSTNAVVHLLAIAGRLGVPLHLNDFDAISRRTPFLANIKPSGQFLMEDFFHAGGVPAVMKELLPLLHRDCITVNARQSAKTRSSGNVLTRK